MRVSIFGGLVAAAMLVGCGAPMDTQNEGADLSTQEAPLPDCSSGDSLNTYYSDATYTTVIGEQGCSCGAWIRWGKTSIYRQFTPECG